MDIDQCGWSNYRNIWKVSNRLYRIRIMVEKVKFLDDYFPFEIWFSILERIFLSLSSKVIHWDLTWLSVITTTLITTTFFTCRCTFAFLIHFKSVFESLRLIFRYFAIFWSSLLNCFFLFCGWSKNEKHTKKNI